MVRSNSDYNKSLENLDVNSKGNKCSHIEYLEHKNRILGIRASENSETVIWDLVLGLIEKYNLWSKLKELYEDPGEF